MVAVYEINFIKGGARVSTTTEYTEQDLRKEIKPLPSNGFKRFFVNIYRKWLEVWYEFCDRHPKSAALIQKVAFFLVFSLGATIWQFVVMTFLPYAFARLNDGAWGWPNVPVSAAGGHPYIIFGDAQGLGYFIAFELAVFTAQCINFPLQRNVTYRSHGNPYFQALWYFIGWVVISVLTSALWGICNCFLLFWNMPDVVIGFAKTVITGTLSMVVFFFIFLIIFPDNAKLAKKARLGCEKARLRGVSEDKLAALEGKAATLTQRALLDEKERALYKARTQSSALALRYFSLKPNKGETDEQFNARKQSIWDRAIAAVEQRNVAESDYLSVKAQGDK